MKILQITPTFIPSNFGGVSLFYNVSKNLAKRGHQVVVFTTDIKDRYSRLSDIQNGRDIDGIKVYYFRNISNSLATKYCIAVPSGMYGVVRKEISNFDIIHLHNVRTFQNIIIHHYAKKYNIPYVLQAHGSLTTFFQKRWLKRIFDALWGYRIIRDASKVIAITNTEAEQYRSMGVSEDKIEVVPNGIDLAEFDNLPKRGAFWIKYGLESSEKIILYLGRIHRTKGLDLLAEAFTQLSKSLNNIKLVIVGPDDGYLPSLKKLIVNLGISNKVIFVGPLYGEEKLKAYVNADVFVTPSFYGFPVTFVEACACRVPIVITEKGDTLDWIHNQVGYVGAYDRDHLKDAISRILTDSNLAEQFGKKGEILVRERFNWTKIVKQLEHIYISITRSS